jgi:hypothetical protein
MNKPVIVTPEQMDKAVEVLEKKSEVAEEKYWDAVEPKEIATKLIQKGAFQFPTNTPICYIFIDKSARFWGKCSHVGGLWKFVTAYEFTIQINNEAWESMTDEQREALMYHELLHVGYDASTDKYSIVDHDLEEFAMVVSKYGLWRDSLAKFSDVVMKKIHDTGEEEEEA